MGKRRVELKSNFFPLAEEILETVPGHVYWKNSEGIYLGCNKELLYTLNLSSLSELIGKTDYDIMPKNLADTISKTDREIISSGNARTIEEIGFDKSGAAAIYLTKKTPLCSRRQIYGLLGISIDVTSDKKVIEKLIDSYKSNELTLENIIALMPGNVYWIDTKGICLGCNNNQLRALNLKSRNEFVGKSYIEVLSKYEAPMKSIIETNEKVLQTGKSITIEEKGLDENGEEAIYLTTKTPLIDRTNNIFGLVGSSVNITDRKRAAKLQAEKEAAEKLAKTMEKISGFIAHEMKTPLAVINVNNDLLGIDLTKNDLNLDSKEVREKINGYHDNIKFAVYSADNVISMLLTKLSNLSTNKLGPSDYEFQSIKKVINTAIKEYPFLKRERKLICWDQMTDPDFKYFGCKDLTKHVFFNLIKNALWAIKEYDKGELFITTKLGDKFNYLIFKDTGMGMTKEHLTKLFQQFITHTEGGTGLGLAFCKTVMNSYGGDITCKSKQDGYTEFTLSFPKDGGKAPTLKQKIAARSLQG